MKKIIILFICLTSITLDYQSFNIINYNPEAPFDNNAELRMDFSYSFNYESKYDSTVWNSIIKNWSSNETNSGVKFQENKIDSKKVSSFYENYTYDSSDIYDNSYDFYQGRSSTLSVWRSYYLEYNSELILRSHKWVYSPNLKVEDYDNTTSLYNFYTSAQPYCESNDSTIITAAETIIGNETSILEIAKSIYLYVASNLIYNLTTEDKPIGAKAALSLLTGDCSEFSSLMVALLRASGIPARKVLGITLIDGDLLSAKPKYDITDGETFGYSYASGVGVPGHAWVQYFVPSIGWVSADPTWGSSYKDIGESEMLFYFNSIDFVHIITSVGDYYGEGIDPELILDENSTEDGIAEFTFFYLLAVQDYTRNFDFSIQIEVLDFNSAENEGTFDRILEFIIDNYYIFSSALIILFLGVAVISKRKHNKENY